MRNYLTFGGADSRDYGVYVSGSGVFNAPARAYSMQSIPGRNGAMVGYDKRFDNIQVTYPAFIYANYKEQIRAWRNYLLSCVGYQRLTDSYHPDEYRLAVYAGPMDVEPTRALKAGKFDMMFDCKPQRFLVSGETVQTFTAAGSIENPTLFDSQPLIRVYGNGTVGIGSVTVTIASNSLPYIDIDCAMMDAFNEATNCNGYVSMSGNDFPVLHPGTNGVTLGGSVTQVQITPRWWRV